MIEPQKPIRPLVARPFRDLAEILGTKLEDAIKDLIERYPEIIPGWDIEPNDPLQFVVLKREMQIEDWSLDLLLVDQHRRLTLIEAKLKENRESRRQVLGQIIEYAAHASKYWGDGRARELAKEYWMEKKKADIDNAIGERFGEENAETFDIGAFWKNVEENLQARKICLIIASDELRPEVRRNIEWLNSEMSSVRVYGLELQCYAEKSGTLVVVPNLIGQSQAIIDRTAKAGRPIWTVDALNREWDVLEDAELRNKFGRVLDWSLQRGIFMQASTEGPGFSIRGRSEKKLATFGNLNLEIGGTIYCYLDARNYPDGAKDRDQFVSELKQLRLLPDDFSTDQLGEGWQVGKSLTKKLREMKGDEVDKLLALFEKYCVESQ